VAFQQGFIEALQLRALAEALLKSGYGRSLLDLADSADA
jgi:glucose-1-phosphate thymidylyltransferase